MNLDEELKKLFSIPERDFGNDYNDKLFEQYKIYVEMAKTNDDRKGKANSYFLSINTGLLSALGFLFTLGVTDPQLTSFWVVGGSIAGILFSYAWVRTVIWFSQLNKARWVIIQEIEKKLPLSIYDTEWHVLVQQKYQSLSNIETGVPKIFMGLYSFLIVISVLFAFEIIKFSSVNLPVI